MNQFSAQPVVNYNLGKGWYLVSAPTITADWNQESDDRWMVFIGAAINAQQLSDELDACAEQRRF